VLGPYGSHLFVCCEFTALGSGFGAGNRFALGGGKDNRRSKIGSRKLHDGARDIILIVCRQAPHGLHGFIEKLCHGHNIRWVGIEVERSAARDAGIRRL
jgi:hypothetical protein